MIVGRRSDTGPIRLLRTATRPLRQTVTAALLIPAAITACGGPAGDASGERRLRPTLASIQREVFDGSCALANCHLGKLPESQLSLVRGRSYRGLVNVPSTQMPELMLVAPHDADRSYLVHKLEGERIVGERIPNNAAPLPPQTIAVIRAWIDRGAPDR